MSIQSRWVAAAASIASLFVFYSSVALSEQGKNAPAKAAVLNFGGAEYVHRWSKNGQNEYTPPSDADLGRWRDMVTINVHEGIRNGDQLAELANRVLTNYKGHGKVVRTDSKPRTPQKPAEHFVAALLGDPNFVEAAFARFVLVDGVGYVAVYSHRTYGKDAGNSMGPWIEANGPSIEKKLMAWDKLPALGDLKRLPQSP